MPVPINSVNPIPHSAVAAVASEPNKTNDAINDKTAVASVKNAKENVIKDKERERGQNKQDHEEKDEDKKDSKIHILTSPIISPELLEGNNIASSEGFKRYLKAIDIYQKEEPSKE